MDRRLETFRRWTAFFVEPPRKSLVGLRMTTVSRHRRNASSLSAWRLILMGGRNLLRDCCGRLFMCSTPMNGWQRRDVVNPNIVSDVESREMAAFWKEEVRQYQV
ncbi:putative retrotransposon hot spot (RHS) protein [Trypanosoma cruzi]|nr:putative retrotransposon hot spot (RHS) protein [Trypanosoma cruzi]